MGAKRVGQGGLATVLMFATGVPPMLTASASVLSPLIREELGISRSEFGLFAVVLFLITAVLSIPLGKLSDRVPFRAGLFTVYVAVFLGLLFAATAQSLLMLLVAAGFGGAGLALVGPMTNRMVGVLGRPSRRGALIATKQSGVQLGQVAASITCSVFVAVFTWRAGLGALAFIALALLVPTLIWMRSANGGDAPQTWTGSSQIVIPTLRSPVLMVSVLSSYSLLSGVVYQSVIFGLPVFAHEWFGLPVDLSGLTLIVLSVLGFLSRLSLGPMMDRARRVRGALVVVAFVALAGIGLLLISTVADLPWALWGGAAVYGLASTAATVICSIAIIRYFPLAEVGSVTGIVMFSTFVGFAIGPIMFASIVDVLGHAASWLVLTVLTAITCVVPFALRRTRSD